MLCQKSKIFFELWTRSNTHGVIQGVISGQLGSHTLAFVAMLAFVAWALDNNIPNLPLPVRNNCNSVQKTVE